MPARSPRAPEPPELSALMVAYQGGDLSAFDGLHDRLAPALRRFLLSVTRNDTWTDDLLQETFLQIHRSRQTYNSSYPVTPWAFAIAHHVFLMARRSRRRRGEFDSTAVAADHLVTRSEDGAIEARDSVMKAMTALSPGTRRAVWLHHVVGWAFADVANKLGIQEAAAKLRASRGMATLRRTLRDRRHDG
jgi:RNA polymerase sigma-70 factor, ECF subfamily